MIGYPFWLNSVDSSPVQYGLDSSQVEEILITGFRVLVHVNRLCAWIKLAPHLNVEGDKQHIHPPAMRCQNSLRHIDCGLAGTGQLTVLGDRFFLCLHKAGPYERPGSGVQFFRC